VPVALLHLLLTLNEVLNYFILASQFFIKLSIVVSTWPIGRGSLGNWMLLSITPMIHNPVTQSES
jgi:hypothetical protein